MRLVDLCREAGATHYLSGPAAKSYLDVELFRANSYRVEWMSYEGYPPYPQLHGAFDPRVLDRRSAAQHGHAGAVVFPAAGRPGMTGMPGGKCIDP